MNKKIEYRDLIEKVISISKEAGKAIMEIYHSDFNYQLKEDLSPLTKADQISHQIITRKLKLITPNIPILSEEGSNIPFKDRKKWKQYWLIDPLDGTKEFIKKNGEFTVNIALIEGNISTLGVINVPATNETFWGSYNNGSFFSKNDNTSQKIEVREKSLKKLKILASRSHANPLIENYLEEIKDYEIINIGSSLKFCLIASGKADIYIRLGPTSEWDIAAGEAIIKYAGGQIFYTNGKTLTYNKRDLLNPNFIVTNNRTNAEMLMRLIKKY
jgi:3'(2'), 5'-bisphosphate nucleotidase